MKNEIRETQRFSTRNIDNNLACALVSFFTRVLCLYFRLSLDPFFTSHLSRLDWNLGYGRFAAELENNQIDRGNDTEISQAAQHGEFSIGPR
jgi:hypothetical protein